jgi:Phage integrase, N-terminal SAM-like domain
MRCPGQWNTGRSPGSPAFGSRKSAIRRHALTMSEGEAVAWGMVMSVASTTRRKTRRKAGRSSILQDEQGRWQGFVSMGRRPDGRRDRRHVRGRTRAEVTVKVRALERQRDAGLPLASGRVPTVEEWVRFWLDHIAAHQLRPRTWEGYWSRARAWIIPCLGECRLDRLSPVRVEGVYSLMVEHGLAIVGAVGPPGALWRAAGGGAPWAGGGERVQAGGHASSHRR